MKSQETARGPCAHRLATVRRATEQVEQIAIQGFLPGPAEHRFGAVGPTLDPEGAIDGEKRRRGWRGRASGCVHAGGSRRRRDIVANGEAADALMRSRSRQHSGPASAHGDVARHQPPTCRQSRWAGAVPRRRGTPGPTAAAPRTRSDPTARLDRSGVWSHRDRRYQGMQGMPPTTADGAAPAAAGPVR